MTTGEDTGESGSRAPAEGEAMAEVAREAGQATFRRLEATLAAAQDGESCGEAARQVQALAEESVAETGELAQRRKGFAAAE